MYIWTTAEPGAQLPCLLIRRSQIPCAAAAVAPPRRMEWLPYSLGSTPMASKRAFTIWLNVLGARFPVLSSWWKKNSDAGSLVS